MEMADAIETDDRDPGGKRGIGRVEVFCATVEVKVGYLADAMDVAFLLSQVVYGRQSDERPAHLARRPFNDHKAPIDVLEEEVADASRHFEGIWVAVEKVVKCQPF